jgi:hypothetical protein
MSDDWQNEQLNILQSWVTPQRELAENQMKLVRQYTEKITMIESKGKTLQNLKVIDQLVKTSQSLLTMANENFSMAMSIEKILEYVNNDCEGVENDNDY